MRSVKFVLSIISPIALILIALYLFLFFRGGKTFDFGKIEFEETTAECVSVGHDTINKTIDRSQEGRPNDKEQYYIEYNYSYRVDGITYYASDRYQHELDDYQSYKKDIEDSQKRIGSTKTLYYNPEKPEKYSFGSKNFEESVSQTNWVIGVMAVLCSVIVLPWILFMGIIRKVLRKRRR